MRAFIYTEYGAPDVLRLADVPKPIPQANELLVKVHASSVSAGSIWIRKGIFPGSAFFTFFIRLMFGITKPRNPILGYEFSGIVEEVGKDVKAWKKGDAIYGTTTGLKQGSYAEYVCIPELNKQNVIAPKPHNVSFEEAAALPVGVMTALHLLQKANIAKGQKVLIYGASGSVGTFAVQIARAFGASVTGVCSTGNVDLVRSLGAENVLDYTTQDFTNCSEQFDVIFDAVGKLDTATRKRLLRQNGQFRSTTSPTAEKREYLETLHTMIAEGKLQPAIDKVYPFEQLVEAHRYVDLGHKKGNVVIKHL
ncbi:MAG: NAD(P)-dependent alcohol dehydrogenase [Candidatus Kapaibacterium sp.]|nr:MAG: NAD(P)-dependent alcohol dehydrogenase [Candidatus Kapabacteria bacterium]